MDLAIIIAILIVPTIAQITLSTTYNNSCNKNNKINMCGQEVARKILDENNLSSIYVVEVNGSLTDHYDSNRKVVRLSQDIFNNNTIASIAVAAHECGHAIQDKENYFFLRLRSLIYPIVRFGTMLSYIVILIGALSAMLDIVYIGIALVSLSLIFQLITLPVEFDASKRALDELKRLKLINSKEETDVYKMLKAAALTYVAGILTSVLEILRLIIVFTRDDRR